MVLGGGMSGMMGMMGSGLLSSLLSGILGGGSDSGGPEGINKLMQGFSPANVLNATANLVNALMGGGVKQATDTLHREDGLPGFLKDAINNAVDEAMKNNQKDTDPQLQSKLNEGTQSDANKTIESLAQELVKAVRDLIKQQDGAQAAGGTGGTGGSQDAGGAGGTGGSQDAGGANNAEDPSAANPASQYNPARDEIADQSVSGGSGKKSAKSWLELIATAMGKVLGEKAARMTELSQKVSDAADAQKNADPDDKQAQQDAAADMNKAQTELSGATQEFKLVSETISTLLKSIGEALSGLARKQ